VRPGQRRHQAQRGPTPGASKPPTVTGPSNSRIPPSPGGPDTARGGPPHPPAAGYEGSTLPPSRGPGPAGKGHQSQEEKKKKQIPPLAHRLINCPSSQRRTPTCQPSRKEDRVPAHGARAGISPTQRQPHPTNTNPRDITLSNPTDLSKALATQPSGRPPSPGGASIPSPTAIRPPSSSTYIAAGSAGRAPELSSTPDPHTPGTTSPGLPIAAARAITGGAPKPPPPAAPPLPSPRIPRTPRKRQRPHSPRIRGASDNPSAGRPSPRRVTGPGPAERGPLSRRPSVRLSSRKEVAAEAPRARLGEPPSHQER